MALGNWKNEFQENLNYILSGFKEIFMDPSKGKHIYDKKIVPLAYNSYSYSTSAITGFINSQIIGQILFYLLIVSILLIFNVIIDISAADTVTYVFTLIFLLGSIETVMVLYPTLMGASVSASHLLDLKEELEQKTGPNISEYGETKIPLFERIEIQRLMFKYQTKESSFEVGPIDYLINRGEVSFIYGGNGSGKTTFIYSLLGILKNSDGRILLNNEEVEADNFRSYRAMFSSVFSDFYLFDEFLQLESVDMMRWHNLLELFEMEGKVNLEDNKLSTIDLSMGQRKRLALIMALMEDKQILVLDEWAADQDPYFRKKFYTEILDFIKSEGRTVIAITHDDKYYECADSLYRMEDGRLYAENVNTEFAVQDEYI